MVRHAQAVRRLDPAALWSSINGNHLPPASASLVHPHLQSDMVIAGTGRDRYASLVVDGGACGPQRGLADPVVVAAQQQVNRVRTAVGGITTVTIGLAGQQQARSLTAMGVPSCASSVGRRGFPRSLFGPLALFQPVHRRDGRGIKAEEGWQCAQLQAMNCWSGVGMWVMRIARA
jgi:hypothetical protein